MAIEPPRGVAFVEFSLEFAPLCAQFAWTQLADDFLQGSALLFDGSSAEPTATYVFGLQDASSGATSSFLLSVQMSVKPRKAAALAQLATSSLQGFLRAMQLKFPGRYDGVQSVQFGRKPVVITRPQPLWVRVAMIAGAVAVGAVCVLLVVKYRKPAWQKLKFKALQFREERRAQVMSELGLPSGMYFVPHAGETGGTVFETPYGNVCIAQVPEIKVPKAQGNFVEGWRVS